MLSDKEIIRNLKNEKISIISKNLNKNNIKILTKLIVNFKKNFNKIN